MNENFFLILHTRRVHILFKVCRKFFYVEYIHLQQFFFSVMHIHMSHCKSETFQYIHAADIFSNLNKKYPRTVNILSAMKES